MGAGRPAYRCSHHLHTRKWAHGQHQPRCESWRSGHLSPRYAVGPQRSPGCLSGCPRCPFHHFWMPLCLRAFSRWQSEPDRHIKGDARARPASFPCGSGMILPIALAARLDAGTVLWVAAWPSYHSLPAGVKKVWTVVVIPSTMPERDRPWQWVCGGRASMLAIYGAWSPCSWSPHEETRCHRYNRQLTL